MSYLRLNPAATPDFLHTLEFLSRRGPGHWRRLLVRVGWYWRFPDVEERPQQRVQFENDEDDADAHSQRQRRQLYCPHRSVAQDVLQKVEHQRQERTDEQGYQQALPHEENDVRGAESLC